MDMVAHEFAMSPVIALETVLAYVAMYMVRAEHTSERLIIPSES